MKLIIGFFVPKQAFYPLQNSSLTHSRAYSPVLINPCLGFNNSYGILGKLNGFSTKKSLKAKNDYILLNLICESSGSITLNGTLRTSIPSSETLIHKDTSNRVTLKPCVVHRKMKNLGACKLWMVFVFPLVMLTGRDMLGLNKVGHQTTFLQKFHLEESPCCKLDTTTIFGAWELTPGNLHSNSLLELMNSIKLFMEP